MTAPTPYASYAHRYADAGWPGVLPLPERKKTYPPTGYTGYGGAYPDVVQLDEWRQTRAKGNIALRMPPTVIGIDVDAYGDKRGRETFEALLAEHGPLPPTWISTSRDDGISAIRFYRIPEGIKLIGSLPGIEIVQRHHRYAVVAPSIHPEGREYRWISPDGEEVPGEVPCIEDLPDLPTTWLEALRSDNKTSKDRRTIATGHEVAPAVDRAYGEAMRGMTQGTRHDSTLAAVTTLVRLEDLGYPGSTDAIAMLESSFTNAVTSDGSRKSGEAQDEFNRMVESAQTAVATTAAIAPAWDDLNKPNVEEVVASELDPRRFAPWDEPRNLPTAPPLPEFPVASLPQWAQAHAVAAADQVQVPVDLTSMLIIGSLSAALTGRARVHVSGNWAEPVNLYLVTAMRSGSGKSPADKLTVEWLRKWQRERIAAVQLEYDRAQANARHARKKLTKLEGGMGEKSDLFRAMDEVAEAEAEVPELPRLLADDATPEAVAGLLFKHGQRLAIMSTEADLFDMLLKGKPGQRQNVNIYLKAWSGDSFIRDRKGGSESGPEYAELDNPLLTCAITVQPSVLAKVQSDDEMVSRGFAARFMFALPEDLIGRRDQRKRFIEDRLPTIAPYEAEAHRLATRWATWAHPADLRVSRQAARLLEDFLVEIEPRLAAGSDFEHLGEWVNKLHGSIARYAGLLHLAEGNDTQAQIDVDTTARAIELGRYWLAHAVAVLGLGRDRASEQALVFLEWAASNGPEFTLTQLHGGVRRPALGLDKVTDYVPGVEALVDLGWLRPLVDGDWRADVGIRRAKSPHFALWPECVGKPLSAFYPRNRSTACMGERDSLRPPSDLEPPSDLTRYADCADNEQAPPVDNSDPDHDPDHDWLWNP